MRRAAIVMVSAVVLTGLVGTPAASATEDASAHVSRALLSPGSVTVPFTLGTSTVHISVDIASVPPITPRYEDPIMVQQNYPWDGRVNAHLNRVGSSLDQVDLVLSLNAGTTASGTWTGSWRVGSGRAGTWQLTGLNWCTDDGTHSGTLGFGITLASVLGKAPQVVVHPINPVRVTNRRFPDVVAYGAPQWERLTYTDSNGRPLAGRTIALGQSVNRSCGQERDGERSEVLDSTGSVNVRLNLLAWGKCALLVVPPTATVSATSTTVVAKTWLHLPRIYYRLKVTPASTVFRIGRPARVTITAQPGYGSVALQVLYGRSAIWRTVTSRGFTTSTFTLTIPAGVNPALVRGTHVYRVMVATTAGRSYVRTSSAPFRMTGR